MDELICELEAATEGSRELDEKICNATNFKYSSGFSGDWDWHPSEEWPHYTTSIDAALTLVPEGYCGELEFGPVKNGRRYGAACVGTKKGPVEGLNVVSPALALCIAALKARNNG